MLRYTAVQIAQIVGTVAIFVLFCIKFYIAIHEPSFRKSGRVAILWTTIYIFFLFTLRLLQLLNIGTIDQLRIISGYAALIPLTAIAIHLWLYKKLDYTAPTEEPKEINVSVRVKKEK